MTTDTMTVQATVTHNGASRGEGVSRSRDAAVSTPPASVPVGAVEIIEWHDVRYSVPDADETVLLAVAIGAPPYEVYAGYLDDGVWRDCTGVQIAVVTHWAEMPGGPR